MKFYHTLFLFILCTPAMVSCSKDDSNGDSSPYEQYGQAFTDMPKSSDAVIYQVNVRSFSTEGNLNGVTQKLDYIKDLGANVVYLMPIYPIGVLNSAGEAGSPYAVQDYKAVNPSMGTLDDLRNLVNEAHNRNMAVILDWVANHTAWDNAWITEHPDWYEHDDQGNIIAPPGTNWTDVAQLDYENNDMRAAMTDAMSYWVYNANIDGFRCDAADMVPQSFWTQAIAKVRSIKNQDLIMLAEGSNVRHFYEGFDYTFGFGFFDAMKKVFNENKPATTLQDANASEYANNYDEGNRIVRYTTNHDVNITDGTPLELFKGPKGSMAAFVVASYMKSVPMLYNAQEIGYDQRIDFLNDEPIDWSNANTDMLNEYKQIIAFRKSSEAVKTGTYTGYSSSSVCVFTMVKGNEKVLVMANLTNTDTNYILPPALSSQSWTDAVSGQPYSGGENVAFTPFQYRILKN